MNDSNMLRHVILSGPLFLHFLEYISRGKMWRFIYSIINPVLWWLLLLVYYNDGYSSIGGIQSSPFTYFPSIVEHRVWMGFGLFILINAIIWIEYMFEYSNFFLFKLLSAIVFIPWVMLTMLPLLTLEVYQWNKPYITVSIMFVWFLWYMFFYNRTNKH